MFATAVLNRASATINELEQVVDSPPDLFPCAGSIEREATQSALVGLNVAFRAPLLRFFQRRTDDPLEAEDLVQEVFERLLRRGRVGELSNLKAYAFETAANVLRDRGRKRRTRCATAHQTFDTERHAGVDVSPEHVLLHRERLRYANAALAQLPGRTRTIFLLRRLNGLRHGEIASQLGISISAVEKHMSRAAAHLEKSFGLLDAFEA